MNKAATLMAVSMLILSAGCRESADEAFTGSGTFEAREILVSSQSSGELLSAGFEEGDTVKTGDILAEIDVEQFRLERHVTANGLEELAWSGRTLESETAAAGEQAAQAEAALGIARKTKDRLTKLFDQGAATREKLDRAKTEYSVALSGLKAAKNKIEALKARAGSVEASRETIKARLRLLDYRIGKGVTESPADGTIIEKYAEAGELAAPGSPICLLADLSSLRLTIYVGEDQLGLIGIGTPAGIRVDSHPDRSFEGTVTWISDEAEFTPKNVQTKDSRLDLVYAVRITVDNTGGVFKIGMPADAFIEGL